ncbi:organic cation transporter protein-like [Macrosteles quadrilineatus]|uniref:organic cation transporter protein-like n=1 Tax=Macrosteles quadrilineatus TaxID=74068 RepID=UPI0023E0A0EC|nr:organic cation transporter protein-like [Macrosteles quadrilineatus]
MTDENDKTKTSDKTDKQEKDRQGRVASQVSVLSRVSPPMMSALEMSLEEINSHIKFVLLIFFLTSVVGVFNAWHILVSNFYAFVPPHWCAVPELEAAGWTAEQIQSVSAVNNTEGPSCYLIGWNYSLFVNLGYQHTLAFIGNTTLLPDKRQCHQFSYDEVVPYSTVVSEWDLVCDRKVQKSNVQGSIAFGKLIGGLVTGFLADMYGRKPVFIACCIIYFISGVGAALTDTFWIFLIARFFAGVAGAGCYESGFTLLSEFVSKKHRATLGCLFNMGYPIGHITLPGLSMIFLNWKHLQMAISLPLIIFILHFWYLPESPRWLLVHKKSEKAWKVIKRYSKNYEDHLPVALKEAIGLCQPATSGLDSLLQDIDEFIPGFSGQVRQAAGSGISEVKSSTSRFKVQGSNSAVEVDNISIADKLMSDLKGIFLLFSTVELCKRITITIFSFIVASLVYYVLALNANNFKLDQHMYTFVAGWVGIPGYVFPLLIMLCMGRKGASSLLFLSSGLSLMIIAAIPRSHTYAILILAMIGRFTNVAVFGLITVYCAELFPTIVRNSAIGVSLAMSQLGSMYAPYVVDLLGPYGWHLPSTICGVATFLAALLILLLPETKGKAFLNTVDDVKERPDKVSFRNCCRFS